jgi:hypothetical protein
MRIEALDGVLNRLKASPALAEFAAQAFEKPQALHFFMGVKSERLAGDFPYVAVSASSGTIETRPGRIDEDNLSLMFGVIEQRPDQDGRNLGIAGLCQMEKLILEALAPNPICPAPAFIWDGKAKYRNDMAIQHPFYEHELMITLRGR